MQGLRRYRIGLIPTLYVMVETRFPRRVESPEISLTPQGESA